MPPPPVPPLPIPPPPLPSGPLSGAPPPVPPVLTVPPDPPGSVSHDPKQRSRPSAPAAPSLPELLPLPHLIAKTPPARIICCNRSRQFIPRMLCNIEAGPPTRDHARSGATRPRHRRLARAGSIVIPPGGGGTNRARG